MASPCPDIESHSERSVQGGLLDEAFVITDTDFTSQEDCDAFASYLYQTSGVNTDISESPLLLSDLDVIVDGIWKPEEEKGLTLMFQAVLNWLKSFGLDINVPAIQEYFPSGESIRLFAEISAGLILLLVFVFTIRGLYRTGLFKFSRKPLLDSDGFKLENDSVFSFESVDGLPLREQLAALLQRSISVLRKHSAVPVSASCTNHELMDHLLASKSALARLFVRQVKLTEPVIYGTRSVTLEALSESQKICEDIGSISHD
ncbi:MAG: hypothetical protein QNL62_25285 [Gammaproteobacteria bacterium]|nr:hypothetical protein [Gammaproteobacteria bacterium]